MHTILWAIFREAQPGTVVAWGKKWGLGFLGIDGNVPQLECVMVAQPGNLTESYRIAHFKQANAVILN